MKYIQAADIHFDMPFTTISARANLGQQRRIDQREAFKKVIEYAKENRVDYLFLCGDIYEDKYVYFTLIDISYILIFIVIHVEVIESIAINIYLFAVNLVRYNL